MLPIVINRFPVVRLPKALAVLAPMVSCAVAAPPVITEQPKSQAVAHGEPVTLRVAASGTEPLAYEWQFAPPGSGSFAPISQTNSLYSIASVTAADTGSYICKVQSGEDTVYSQAAVISLLTNLPNVSLAIVTPTNGAGFQTPVNVPTTLTVAAVLSGELLHSRVVEFSANGSVIGVVGGTTNFTFNWSNVVIGQYTLQAASLEWGSNALVTFTSDPILVEVAYGGFGLIPPGAAWKYHDDGTPLAADWKTIGYNDALWLTGQGQFGYGDGDEQTYLRFSSGPDTNFITSYFRRTFVVPDPGAYSNLQVRLLRDDGAVVYLNGVEMFRDNMPEGEIDRFTVALRGLGLPEESTFYPTWVNPSRLHAGTNVLAVELHQIIPFAGDASFDLALIGNVPVLPPEIRITHGPTNTVLSWPADFPGYKLQSATEFATAPSATVWNSVPASVTLVGGEFRAAIQPSGEHRFFRLAVE